MIWGSSFLRSEVKVDFHQPYIVCKIQTTFRSKTMFRYNFGFSRVSDVYFCLLVVCRCITGWPSEHNHSITTLPTLWRLGSPRRRGPATRTSTEPCSVQQHCCGVQLALQPAVQRQWDTTTSTPAPSTGTPREHSTTKTVRSGEIHHLNFIFNLN